MTTKEKRKIESELPVLGKKRTSNEKEVNRNRNSNPDPHPNPNLDPHPNNSTTNKSTTYYPIQ